MNEENEIIIGTDSKKIVQYIYENPKCSWEQIRNAFKGKKPSINTLKFYLRGMRHQNEVYEHGYLIRLEHVIPHGESEWGGNNYDDIFEFNEEKLNFYPELMRKTIISLGKKRENLMNKMFSEDTRTIFSADIESLMDFYITIEINQKPNSREFYFSDKAYFQLRKIVKLLIFYLFLNNPDLWYIFYNNKNKESLDFSIEVKTKFSEAPRFFGELDTILAHNLFAKNLYNECFTKVLSEFIKDLKKNQKLDHDDIKSFYAKAKFEHENRIKEQDAGEPPQDPSKLYEVRKRFVQLLSPAIDRDNPTKLSEINSKLVKSIIEYFGFPEKAKDVINPDFFINLFKDESKYKEYMNSENRLRKKIN